MSQTVQIQIDKKSLRNMLNTIDRLPAELRRSAERAVLRAGAKPVLAAVKSRVPVKSGLMKTSIGISVRVGGRAGKEYGEAQIGARNGVKYRYKNGNKTGRRAKHKKGRAIATEEVAWYQEMGTSKMPANPFIRPGVEAAQGAAFAAMAAGFDSHLTKVAARLAKK